MFVRKGTVVRKGRGSGRKSIRRPARESNANGSVPRKVTVHDDPPSTGSASYRIPASPEFCSTAQFRLPPDEKLSRDAEDCLTLRQMRTEDRYTSAVDNKIYQDHVRPSPARSVGNTIVVSSSFCIAFCKHTVGKDQCDY